MENKVWYYRDKRNLTLKQLSKLTGISVGELSNIENNVSKDIMLSNAVILSKVLHADLYDYFVLNKYGGSDELWEIICFLKLFVLMTMMCLNIV